MISALIYRHHDDGDNDGDGDVESSSCFLLWDDADPDLISPPPATRYIQRSYSTCTSTWPSLICSSAGVVRNDGLLDRTVMCEGSVRGYCRGHGPLSLYLSLSCQLSCHSRPWGDRLSCTSLVGAPAPTDSLCWTVHQQGPCCLLARLV